MQKNTAFHPISESPDTIYGRLQEAAHHSGYGFERLCSHLEWLLEDERWKQVGSGYEDASLFLKTIDLSPFKMEAADRKRLAKLLTETLEASQRATAKALGVSHQTVMRDVDSGPNGPPNPAETPPATDSDETNGPNGPPATLTGRQAAQELEKQQKAKTIREGKRAAKLAQLEDLKNQENKAAQGVADVVIIDPPWPIGKIERNERPNQVEFDYPVMAEDEIGSYVEDRAPFNEDCHVWLWTTQRFLPLAFELLERWGLKYVCTFVWHKPGGFQPVGLPQYNSEFALYARKGSPIFRETVAFPVCFMAGREGHSEKPLEFYAMVRRVTAGRRIEIFNRRSIPGFEGEGNEAV